MSVTVRTLVEVELTPGTWTAIDPDVAAGQVLTIARGITGNGPLDLVAGTGVLQCALRNDARNSALIQGYYSPAHESRQAGWAHSLPIRVSLAPPGWTQVVVFRGTIWHLAPEAGRHGSRRVLVTAYDAMRVLADADLREVSIQVDRTETELLETVLAALPAAAQPPATAFDPGVDTYPYAFDDLAGGAKALAVASDVVVSAFGVLFVAASGALTYRTRHAIGTTATAYDLSDDDLVELTAPSSADQAYTRVRATTHPKAISAAATDELYTLAAGTTIEIPAGETREVWTDYTDPLDRQTPIGGLDVVEAVAGGTHYAANSLADGSGTDLTGTLAASLEAFSSTAKWTLANTGVQAAHVRTLRVIGKAVRDPGPQTFESYGGSSAGERPLAINLPYQDDPQIGQSAADFVRAQYARSAPVDAAAFPASKSVELMTQALLRDIGDRVTVRETVTGITAGCLIRSVALEVSAGGWVNCQWGLRPASPFAMWQLGIAGASELGVSTTLGF